LHVRRGRRHDPVTQRQPNASCGQDDQRHVDTSPCERQKLGSGAGADQTESNGSPQAAPGHLKYAYLNETLSVRPDGRGERKHSGRPTTLCMRFPPVSIARFGTGLFPASRPGRPSKYLVSRHLSRGSWRNSVRSMPSVSCLTQPGPVPRVFACCPCVPRLPQQGCHPYPPHRSVRLRNSTFVRRGRLRPKHMRTPPTTDCLSRLDLQTCCQLSTDAFTPSAIIHESFTNVKRSDRRNTD